MPNAVANDYRSYTSMWILVATWQGDSDCWNETEIQLIRDREGAVWASVIQRW